MQTRFRRLHIETHDESTKLDILGERVNREERGPSDRTNLNAWLQSGCKGFRKAPWHGMFFRIIAIEMQHEPSRHGALAGIGTSHRP